MIGSAPRYDDRRLSVPVEGTGGTGLTVFLLALGMVFAAGIALYVVARTGELFQVTSGGADPISIPAWLWFSTFFLFASSVLLEGGRQFSRMGRPRPVGSTVLLATLTGWAFIVLQVPGLVELVGEHRRHAPDAVMVYALIVFLVGLHLLHAVGGVALLTGFTVAQRTNGAAPAERLTLISRYWHFLAIVWLVMFSVFLAL